MPGQRELVQPHLRTAEAGSTIVITAEGMRDVQNAPVHTTTQVARGRETRMDTSYPTDARPARIVTRKMGQGTPRSTHFTTSNAQALPPNRIGCVLGRGTTNIESRVGNSGQN